MGGGTFGLMDEVTRTLVSLSRPKSVTGVHLKKSNPSSLLYHCIVEPVCKCTTVVKDRYAYLQESHGSRSDARMAGWRFFRTVRWL